MTVVVGWCVGGNPKGKSAAAADRSAQQRERPSRLEQRVRRSAGPTGEAAERLAAIRAARDPLERTRATIALANTLPVSEFAAWLDGSWFQPQEGGDVLLFKAILMERWPKEDPEGMFSWCMENGSDEADSIVEEWIETNPQRMIDFFKLHPNDEKELAILRQIAGKNPALALERLQQMGSSGISSDILGYATGVIKEIAAQSPAALEAVLESLPSKLKFDAECFLIGRKMETAFPEEFAKLLDRPDGVMLFRMMLNHVDSLHDKIVDVLPDLPVSWRSEIGSYPYTFVDKDNAAKWLAADLEGLGFDKDQARRIRSESIDELRREQPEVALHFLGDAGLLESERRSHLTSIFFAVKNKPEKAAEFMALLTSDGDRQFAREAMGEKETLREPEIAFIDKPADWLAAVAALDPESSRAYEYFYMMRKWGSDKMADVSRQFESLPDDKRRILAKMIIEDGDSGILLGGAIRYYATHPPDGSLEMGSGFDEDTADDSSASRKEVIASQIILISTKYVTDLAEEEPEQAVEWLHSLPDGDAKLWATRNLKSVWSQYDPTAADKWFNSLPANVRSQVQGLRSKSGD